MDKQENQWVYSIINLFRPFDWLVRCPIAVHAFASHVLMSVSVDETLLPRKVNLSTSFRELPFCVEMSPL